MTGVSKTTVYTLTWENEGLEGVKVFTFHENQYKENLKNGEFDPGEGNGLIYGEGSYTVKKGTGYVRTWQVKALHFDGSFRIASITQ